jgi:hypothetical protein
MFEETGSSGGNVCWGNRGVSIRTQEFFGETHPRKNVGIAQQIGVSKSIGWKICQDLLFP